MSSQATVEAASNREYITEGDAFTLMFTLPFRREDVYRELVSPRQLGVDHTTVKISVTKRSDAAEERLQRKLRESARGNEASEIKQHLQESALAELSVGCERTVNFPDGTVVSELVELVDNQRSACTPQSSHSAPSRRASPPRAPGRLLHPAQPRVRSHPLLAQSGGDSSARSAPPIWSASLAARCPR